MNHLSIRIMQQSFLIIIYDSIQILNDNSRDEKFRLYEVQSDLYQ